MVELPQLSGERRALLEEATERYAAALPGSEAAEYLAGRGVDLRTAQAFKLGVVAEPVNDEHQHFRGRIAIPYLTPAGTVGMRFRAVGSGDPKFTQERGMRTALYNVLDLHRSEPWIALCEGEPDTWVMSKLIGVPAIGIPGVDHWTLNAPVWSRLLQDYESVFIVMDPDKAGQKIVADIHRRVENPVVVDLPADVNDTYSKHGADFVLSKMGLLL